MIENLTDLLNQAADAMEADAKKISLLSQIADAQERTINAQRETIDELKEYIKYANQVIEALYDNLDDAYERAENS